MLRGESAILGACHDVGGRLYGPGLASGAVSQILSDDWSANGQTSNNIRWALSDIRGSVRELVSGASTSGVANNAEVAAFHYDSFGQLTAGSGSPAGTHGPSAPSPAAVDFLFGYAGGVYDGETAAYNSGQALYHMGAREYTPVLGQFLSQDPIHADVVNPYRYAGNDPVNGTDPSGLFTRSVNASLIGSVFGGSGALSGLLAAEEEEAEEEAAAAASLRSASYGRANYGGLTYGGSSGNPALTFSGTTLDYGSRYAALNAPLSPLQLVQQNLATSNSPPSGPAVAASQASSTTWVWPWSSNATWNTVNTLATWTGGDAETLAIGLTKGGENVLTGVRSAALEMPRLAADVTVGTALAGYDRLGAATGLWNVSSIQKTPYSMTGQSVAAQLESGASYLGTATSTFGSGLFSAGTLGIGPSAVGAYKYFDTGDPTEWQTAAGGQFVASSVPLGVKYGSAIASTVRASSELISPGWLPEQPLLNRHYTSPSGLAGIKRDMAINPSRGDIIGVDVEMGPPFGTAKPWGLSSPQRQLGLSKGGAYVEFNRVGTEISTPWVSESSRVTARIPTESPLSLEGLDPRFVTVRWWKPWTWNQ